MIKIKPCKIKNQSFSNGYYDMYYAYQKELRVIDKLIKDPIESETGCIVHQAKTYNYKDCVVYSDGTPIGIVAYQDVNFLDDGQAPILYIDHFYIKPEFRHRSLGRQTFQELINKYSSYVIFFYVLTNNFPAVPFWQKVINSTNVEAIHDERCKTDQEVAGEYDEPYIKHVLRSKNGK